MKTFLGSSINTIIILESTWFFFLYVVDLTTQDEFSRVVMDSQKRDHHLSLKNATSHIVWDVILFTAEIVGFVLHW